MSEQKRVEQRKISYLTRKYRAERLAFDLLNKSEMLTAIADKNSPYFYWVSESWLSYLGYTFEELTNVSFFDLIHVDDIEESFKYFENFKEKGGQEVGFDSDYYVNRYKAKDGSYKRIKWNRPVSEEGSEYMITAYGID